MGNRRFAQVSTSDEEDEVPATKQQFSNSEDNLPIRRKRKKMKFIEEEEEELEEEGEERNRRSRRSRNKGEKEVEAYKQQADDENEDDQSQEDAKPVGDAVRVSGKGRGRKSHYNAFEYDGNRYDLVSYFVLLVVWFLVLLYFFRILLSFRIFFSVFVNPLSIDSCMGLKKNVRLKP